MVEILYPGTLESDTSRLECHLFDQYLSNYYHVLDSRVKIVYKTNSLPFDIYILVREIIN